MPTPLEEILSRLQILGGSQVGGSSQYASFLPILNASGVLDPSFFAGTHKVTEVANQAARLALSNQNPGDVVKQLDTNVAYVLKQAPSSTDSNWVSIGTDVSNVSGSISYDPGVTGLVATTVQDAIDEVWARSLVTDLPRTSTALVTFNNTGAPFAIGSNATGQLVTGLNADLLDGQHGAYYRNASNLNAGTVPSDRLSGTYPINISGTASVASVAISAQTADLATEATHAADADTADLATLATTATLADNSTNLNGQPASYYLNAANLSAGILPAARFDDTSHGNRGGGALHALATIFAHGFMSKDDKYKLESIEAGAEANQNAFSTVKVGNSTIVADAEQALVEFASVAPELTITTDVPNKKVIFDFDLGSIQHDTLGGLADDDHLQYVHKDNARTITAVHTFNPTSVTAPFAIGINAANQLVVGLNAERLNGKTDTYFQNASNLNAGTVPVGRLAGTYNINISGTAAGSLPTSGGTLLGPLTVPALTISGLANPVAALATDSLGNVVPADENLFFNADVVKTTVAGMFVNSDYIVWTYNAVDKELTASVENLNTDIVAEGNNNKYVTWQNVQDVLALGNGLILQGGQLNTRHTTTPTADRLVMRDVDGNINAVKFQGNAVAVSNEVDAGSVTVPQASNLKVRDYTPGQESKLIPVEDNEFATKYFVEQQAANHEHPIATYDLPITTVANSTARLALTGLKIGELVAQTDDNTKIWVLIKYPINAAGSWMSFTPVPTTLADPGFISATDRAEILKLASLVESQAAANVFLPTMRVTEPLKGPTNAPGNYTNPKWRMFSTRSVQVRGRNGKKYFLLLSVKGWVKKQHKWELVYYKDSVAQTPVVLNEFTVEQPPRGTAYSIDTEYEYVDKIVPLFVDGQSPITLSVYAFDGKFTNPPGFNTNDTARVIFPGIAPFSVTKVADPFNGGFIHLEGKGVWSDNTNEPFQPYAPDLFMLQAEGEVVGGGLTYYPADASQDGRIYDGEQIYDAQDKAQKLRRNGFLDENETIPKYEVTQLTQDATLTFEKARIRCNYTVYNKLQGFNGFLRPDNSVTSGKGLTKRLVETVDQLFSIPLNSHKLTDDITGTTIFVKGGDPAIEVDITGFTNLQQVIDELNAHENLSCSYNPLTDRVTLIDTTTPKTDETIAPPVWYDATEYPNSQALRVLRIAFGGTDTWTGVSLPVASGLRTVDIIKDANFANTVAVSSTNTGKFRVDDIEFSYDPAADTIDDVIADLATQNITLVYDKIANEFVLKRKDGTTTDYASIIAPRAFDVRGNLVTAMGLEKESHGNADFPLEAVHKLFYQPDGIWAAGNFKNYCGVTTGGLAKIKFDGKNDPFFNLGLGFDGSVYSITSAEDATTDVVVAGLDAVSLNGFNRKGIFRIRQNGTENTKLNIPYTQLSDDNQTRVLSVISLNGVGDIAVLTPRKLLIYDANGTLLRTYEGTKSFHGMVKYREDIGQTYFLLTSQAYVGPTTTQKFNGVGEPLGLRLMVYNHSTHDVTIDPVWAQAPSWDAITGFGAGAGTGAEASCAYPIVGGADLNRYVICGNRGAWWGSEIEEDSLGNTAWNERGAGNLILESENYKVPTDALTVIQSATSPNVVIEIRGDYHRSVSDGYKFNVTTAGAWGAAVVTVERTSAPNVALTTIVPVQDGSTAYSNWLNVDPGDSRPNRVQVRFRDLQETPTGAFALNDNWIATYQVPAIPTIITQDPDQDEITVGLVTGPLNPQSSSDELRAITYTIEVTNGGAWGAADITITPSIVSPDPGGDTVQTINDVQKEVDIALGSRGLKFQFAQTAGGTDTLVTGDTWKIQVWPWQEGGLGLDPMVEATDGYGRTYTVLTNDTANSSEVGYIYQDFDASTVRFYANGATIANNGNVHYLMVAQVKKDNITNIFPYIGLEFGDQSSFSIGCRLNTATGAYDADLPGHDGTAEITVEGNKPSNPDFWIVKIKVHDTNVPNKRVRPVIYPAYTNVFDGGAKTPVSRSITLYGVALQYEPWADTYVRTTTQPLYVSSGSTANKFRGLYKIGLEGDKRGKAWDGFATWLTHSEAQSHPIPFAVDKQNRVYVGGPVNKIQKADNSQQDVTPWRLYRLTETGKFDKEYNFNDTVTSALITPDDKLVVAGRFTCYNKRAVGKFCFLTLDGDLLENIMPQENDVIVGTEEPDVDLYPEYKDKIWMDTSTEPPALKVYDDDEDIWINALSAAKRITDPVFRTDPPNTYTDPAKIYIDVPGFTVKGSGWTDPKDVKVTYKVNDINSVGFTYDPEDGILLPAAGSYTIYASAEAPASVEWYNSKTTYQYFTVRAQCEVPAVTTTEVLNGVQVDITTAAGTLGSKVLYYTYPTGQPPQSVTWLPADPSQQQTAVSFVTNKNITVKSKAVKTGMRDSAVVTTEVTIVVGNATITPKSPAGASVLYIDRVGLQTGTKGTGVLYSIGPAPTGGPEPTIANYMNNNAGASIILGGSNFDVNLMDPAKQESYFGGVNGASCIVKARTVIAEVPVGGTAAVPVVEQATTMTTTINRETQPTLNPNGFLVKDDLATSYTIKATTGASKNVRYDITLAPATPDADVLLTDQTAAWDGTSAYNIVHNTGLAPDYKDFILRTRVFVAGKVPSQRQTVNYYFKRPGPTINVINDPTYGLTKFTITPTLTPSATRFIRYTLNPSETPSRTVGIIYTGEVSLENIPDGYFQDNKLTIKAVEYDTNEDTKFDAISSVEKTRANASSPASKLNAILENNTELTDAGPNILTYDTAKGELLNINTTTSGTTIFVTYNSNNAITSTGSFDKKFFGSGAYVFTPPLAAVNSGELTLRWRIFASNLIPSTTRTILINMKLPPVAFDPPSYTDFLYEGDVKLSNGLSTAVINYTINNTPVTVASKKYYRPIRLRANTYIRAQAIKTGWLPSTEQTGVYSFNAPPWSIVALPDTQHYSESNPWIYDAQTQWALDNESQYNIKAVFSLGDMVEHGESGVATVAPATQAADAAYGKLEFVRAYKAMDKLTVGSPDMIWTPCFGNHDISDYKSWLIASVNTTADTMTLVEAPSVVEPLDVTENSRVKFYGDVPGGLQQNTWYYITNLSGSTFSVRATFGGSVIDLTSAGGKFVAVIDKFWEMLSYDDTTDVIYNQETPTADHWVNGRRVRFYGTLPPPLVAGTWYYLRSVDLTNLQFQVAATAGGPAIDLTAGGGAFWADLETTTYERTTLFNHYFPEASFTSRWNGAFECRSGHVETSSVKMTINGEDWMFITLPYDVTQQDVDWVLGQIDANIERKLVLMPHSYMEPDGDRTPEGSEIYTKIILTRLQAKWVMVLCGHRYVPKAYFHRAWTLPNGTVMHEILSDYQNTSPFGGGGWLRHLTFHPSKGKIVVKTFSPIANNMAGSYWTGNDVNQNMFEVDHNFECFARGFADAKYGLVNLKFGQQLLETPVIDIGTGNILKKLSIRNDGTVNADGDIEILSNQSNLQKSWKGKGIFGLTDEDYWNVVKEEHQQIWNPPRDARGTGNANGTLEVRKYFNVTEAPHYFGDGITDPNANGAKTVVALENTGLKAPSGQVLAHVRGLDAGKYLCLAYGQKTEFALDMYGGICRSAGTGNNANKGKSFYNFGYPIYNFTKDDVGQVQYDVNVYPVRVFKLKGLKKLSGTGNFDYLTEYVKTVFVPYSWWVKIGNSTNVSAGRAKTGVTFYAEDGTTVLANANGRIYMPHTSQGDAFNGYWQGVRRVQQGLANNSDSTPPISSGYNFDARDGWEFIMVAPAIYAGDVPTVGGQVVAEAANYVTNQSSSSGNINISRLMLSAYVGQTRLFGAPSASIVIWNGVSYSSAATDWPEGTSRWSLGQPTPPIP